jgi:hypothetical protein
LKALGTGERTAVAAVDTCIMPFMAQLTVNSTA